MADTRSGKGRALLLLGALCLTLAGAGAADTASSEASLAKARAALSRGDGVAAEMAYHAALDAGAAKNAVTVGMGEALLAQGKLDDARKWLSPAGFAPAEGLRGYRMLARLERAQGHFAEAAKALDKALQLAPRDAEAWVDAAELRYGSGEQVQAVEALDKALAADPANIRALDFRGLVVRDQYGPAAALPWFEAGLLHARDDPVLLGDYAATLGEAGEARRMLAVTRHMTDIGADVPRALFLQAVLAARGGNPALARALLNRAGKGLAETAAWLQLDGVLHLAEGNAELAVMSLGKLAARQPLNEHAQMLHARALMASGQAGEVVTRYGAAAIRPGASPFLMTLVGRALEDLGRREEAAPLLDRASAALSADLVPVSLGGVEPASVAEARAVRSPGSALAQELAGDALYAAGRFGDAAGRYAQAARVRQDEALLARLVLSLARSGDKLAAANAAANYLSLNPQSRAAARIAADYAASVGDWSRARSLLTHLRRTGSGHDVRLLADLAYADLRAGDRAAAAEAAGRALELQPASPLAAQALAAALPDSERPLRDALLRRARQR